MYITNQSGGLIIGTEKLCAVGVSTRNPTTHGTVAIVADMVSGEGYELGRYETRDGALRVLDDLFRAIRYGDKDHYRMPQLAPDEWRA